MRHARRQFGPIAVDRLTQRHALARVQGLMRVGAGGMVLTPGANDVVLAHRVPRLREAYQRVSMSLPDAASIGAIARLAGLRVVGTDCSVWKGTPDQALVRRIQASGARVVLVALPSPQQEMWMLQHTAMLAPAITFGIGETLQRLGDTASPRETLLGRVGRAVLTLRVLSVLMTWRFSARVRAEAPPPVPARPWALRPLPPSRSR